MDQEEKAKGFDKIWQVIREWFTERKIKDVDSWDGSASQWPDTASYCDACLINENEGARDEWVQSKCKLPVRGPGDSEGTFVRQAVHAAAARFNQVDAPAEAKESARRKLVAAYEEMGEEPPEVLTRAISMSRLHQAVWGQLLEMDRRFNQGNYLMDIYADEGMLYALVTDQGKLYRYLLSINGNDVTIGERVQVIESHSPVQTRTIVRQQADGRYRWFSISGTATLNRAGEIDSRDLFDSFIAHSAATGEYPVRQFYHQGATYRTGLADFLARDGHCYLSSGLYDDTPLAQAEVKARQIDSAYWGESIGFVPTESELVEISDGIKIPVYRRGINVEISTLPEKEAAHLFTKTEVTRMLEGKTWEAFVKLWGDDEEKARQWLEANPQARNRAIDAAGLITRQETPTEIEIDETVIATVTRSVLDSEAVKVLSVRLAETEAGLKTRATEVGELKATIANLTTRLEKLEHGEMMTQRQLDDDTPAKLKTKTRLVYRPREAHGNGGQQADGSQVATATLDKIGLKY